MKKTAIPSDLLVWEEWADWRVKLGQVVPADLKRQLSAGFRKHPPIEAYVDSLCWLDDYIPSQQLDDASEQIAAALTEFRCRAYHFCRSTAPRSYLDHGILTLDPTAHSEALWTLITADERLRCCRDRARFDAFSAKMIHGIDVGKTFLGLDRRLADDDSGGHYLIWGSESWSNVLAHLGGDSARDVLSTIGVPTVFIIDFPLSIQSPDCHRHLAEHFLEVWMYGLARRLGDVPIRDYTFFFHQDVPAPSITGHFHPQRIPYPSGLGVGVYQNPHRQCELCMPEA